MKREILFRGKRKDNGKWVEGHLIVFPKSKITKIMVWNAADLDFDAIEVIPEAVGQFVGRCDSNGTKIFAGNIVKIMDGTGCANPIVGVIQFENCGFLFKFGKYGKVLFGDWVTECYVIGDIHDNPELLNGTES